MDALPCLSIQAEADIQLPTQLHSDLQEFGCSGEDFLPGFGQLESYQTSADEGDEGQEDGDNLSDADECCKNGAGEYGSKLADPIQDAKRCPSAEQSRDMKIT